MRCGLELLVCLAARALSGLGDLGAHPPSPLLSLQLPPEAAYDVLSVADMYLLPGLKRLCGRSLAQLLDEDSVVGVWRVAKLFRLARLEDQCTEYMAKVIEKVGPWEPWWVGQSEGGRRAALSWLFHSWWSGKTSWMPCGRRRQPWLPGRRQTPSHWWTTSVSTWLARCRPTAPLRRPSSGYGHWRTCWCPSA